MTSVLILALCAPSALAAKGRIHKVDAARASALGAPSRHAPLASCTCAELTWEGTETQRLQLRAAEVASVHHVVADEGMHSLVLRTVDGVDLTVDQAPCTFIAEQAVAYSRILGTVSVAVDASGAAVTDHCAAPGQVALNWVDELSSRTVIEVVSDLNVPLARVTVSTPDAGNEAFVETAQRELTKLRPVLGHCFVRGGDSAGPDAVLQATLSDDGVSAVDVSGPGTGVPEVDACLVDAVSGLELSVAPTHPVRLDLQVQHER